VRETESHVGPDVGKSGAGPTQGHGHINAAAGDPPLDQPADLDLACGESARQLDARLEEPVVEGAGLGQDDYARTPGLGSSVPRHAEDQAHEVPTMLADAVGRCQRERRGARSELCYKTSIPAHGYRVRGH